MDRQFMEFWGNFLLNAAKSQKQIEDMTAWMKGGFTGFDELSTLFRKIYGLEKAEAESPDTLKTWAQAQTSFMKSFRDYLALLSVVPLDEHVALVKKYEELKERVESQEETIKHLRMLCSERKKEECQEVAGQFEELVQKQADQFQQLMANFAPSPKKKNKSS